MDKDNEPYNKIKIIQEIEQLFDVNGWIFENIHLWPLIKISISANILKGNNHNTQCNKTINQEYIKKKNTVLKELSSTDILFLSNEFTKVQENEKWIDSIIDPISKEWDNLGFKTLHIETIEDNSKYYENRNFYLFTHKKNKSFSYNENITWKDFDRFIDYLKSNLDIKELPSIKKTILKYKRLELLSEEFTNIINKTNPKFIFFKCFYNDYSIALNIAAQKQRIPTIDIQHGIISGEHFSYGNWSKIPTEGYTLLPNYFFTWDKEGEETINKWGKGIHTSISCGHPNIQKRYIKKQRIEENVILFSLQPKPNDKINDLERLIKNSPDSWKWLIRLHPTSLHQIKEVKYKLKNHLNIEIDKSSSCSLTELLPKVNFHVSQYSSVAIESQLFNIQTVFLNGKYAEKVFPKLYQDGWAISFQNSLEECFQKLKKTPKIHNKDKDKSILSAINFLLEKNKKC